MGPPPPAVWQGRREAAHRIAEQVADSSVRALAEEYEALLERYAQEAAAAGPGFVEIQNTMLFAAVGQKPE
jgi:hypothetical protein